MHEFFAKIARHAFGKGAAFCYAVTVAVSGQLAYNYLKPRDPASTVSAAAPSPKTGGPPASLAGATAIPAKPVSAPPAATAPILPEPPSLSLPSPAALPAPALKPAALPPSRPPAAHAVEPSPAPGDPAEKAAAPATAKPAPPPDRPLPYPRAVEAAQPAGNPDAAPDIAITAPIPLLPSSGAAEAEKTAAPVRPGPGSGGLY